RRVPSLRRRRGRTRAEGRRATAAQARARAPCCSRSRLRRSWSGRALVTYGTESKLCGGGGEGVYHSSVSACQGSLPTRGPRRVVRTTFQKKTRIATPMTYEPIVEVMLYPSQLSCEYV